MTEATSTPDSPDVIARAIFTMDKYRDILGNLAITGETNVSVSFIDIAQTSQDIATTLINNPNFVLTSVLNTAAREQMRRENPDYANLEDLKVRVYDLLDTTAMRQINSALIRKFVMVKGIVMRAGFTHPRVTQAMYKCRRCGSEFIEPQLDTNTLFLKKPVECRAPDCGRDGPFDFIEEESEYVDEQDIWIQESPEELPPGDIPRTLHLKLRNDLVDYTHPGDDISVVGIVKSMAKRVKGGTMNVFETFVEVNSVKILGKEPEAIADPCDLARINELSQDPQIITKIVESIAPSIFGGSHIKEAIMYLLFGGVDQTLADMKIRGEMNILLIGDPGTAKTQTLRYVAKLAPRGLFTSGGGVTGVGLTAAVVKDPDTGTLGLEAGALVLADKGVCCIDELDKMHDNDRDKIHETLEQRTVSIAKGGIIATMNARCAVLAAGNPVMGRYNRDLNFVENISLPIALISRFDLIFLLLDIPNEKRDAETGAHILGLHNRHRNETVPIDMRLLRKYITYARQQVTPVLSPEATKKILDFYLKMRKTSGNSNEVTIILGARQLEALVRISEARARACLRANVTSEDAEAAIKLVMRSLKEVGVDVETGKIDIDMLNTGKPKSVRDKISCVLVTVVEMQNTVGGMVRHENVLEKLEKDMGITAGEAERLIQQLLRESSLYEPREGFLKKA
jgi:replicative DNA helicase Mcm